MPLQLGCPDQAMAGTDGFTCCSEQTAARTAPLTIVIGSIRQLGANIDKLCSRWQVQHPHPQLASDPARTLLKEVCQLCTRMPLHCCRLHIALLELIQMLMCSRGSPANPCLSQSFQPR